MKFLIIDRSADIRSSIKKIININSAEHVIIESAGFDDSLYCLYSTSPDYVIIDPETFTDETVLVLKSALALLPASRIFLFTELTSESVKEKLMELGIKKLFSKSDEVENLINELSLVLADSSNTENSSVFDILKN